MRIGIDFDNTIADYDRLFIRLAAEEGWPDAGRLSGKRAVRQAAWASEGGDLAWQRLQAQAYGPRLSEARPFAGVREFIAGARAAGAPVFIVSHKTRFAAADREKVDLHEAALHWLAVEGFLDPAAGGLAAGSVHFETSRSAKIARIEALGLTHFIDDLEEVLCDPAFPASVEAILFDPAGATASGAPACRFAHWQEISDHVFQRCH